MRIGIDYTSALAQRAGVGRYTRHLVDALLDGGTPSDDRFVLYSAGQEFARATAELAGAELLSLRLPQRPLTLAWHRLGVPLALEHLTGSLDVNHGPDFVVPPSRAPSVVTIHDLTYLMTPQYAYPRLRRYLERAVPRSLRRASRIITVSDTTRRDLLTHYTLDESTVVAIPNGVSRHFTPPEPAHAENRLETLGVRPPYFLTVGTIEPRKNHSGLLRAFAQLADRYADVSLVIAGRPGWLAAPILAEIAAASRRYRVQLRSDLDDADLPALYAGAIATVYPSWYEGFGLPVLEAMACGGATVASDRGALPEVAGEAALVAPPDDLAAIAAAMERLLLDEQERRRLGQCGLLRAAGFSWQRTARETRRVYAEAAV